MTIQYKTRGTCSTHMTVEVEDGVVRSVRIQNGCSGNLQGISRLVEGMKVDDVIARLEGIRCGRKPTSCPDQLARALKRELGEEKQEPKKPLLSAFRPLLSAKQ